MSTPLLSICIPAYGRLEYVRNTLNSIYSENNLKNYSLLDFEVVLSDNDPLNELECLKNEFKFSNFHYYNTDCEGFLNSFHVLTLAKGEFLLLHNSQELFRPNALIEIINLINCYSTLKPCIFFTSGFLLHGNIKEFNSFDSFMSNLSYWSSWSNGFGIWNEDFQKIKTNLEVNKLFPHTSLLLTQHYKQSYIIDDTLYFKTQFVKKRGGHNKFHAFSVQFPSLIHKSFLNNNISHATKSKILRDILFNYLPLLFFNVKISRREKFSSDGFKNDMKLYFNRSAYYLIFLLSMFAPFKILLRKLKLTFLEYKNTK